MEKLNQSQSLKLLPIAALLIITPLLSTSLRFKYLYFIVNILIIAVGAEAGLLSFFVQSEENKKPPTASVAQKPVIITEVLVSSVKEEKVSADKPLKKPVEVAKIKKSPSNPSIFFIGGGESTHAELMEENEGEEVGDISEQELYQKAEIFIGNFYKQLKMQREESWQKLHHLSQKAF